MADETTSVVAPQAVEGQATSAPVETPTPITPSPLPAVTETPSWQQELDKVEAKDLLSHPKLRGIIGSEVQRIYETKSKRDQEEESRKAHDRTQAEFLKAFGDNAEYFKQNYPDAYEFYTEQQKEKAMRELGDVQGKTRHELAANIGRAFQDVPEWKDLTSSDHELLAKAVIGRPDDEVIPIFNRTALDLIANRRAEKLLADWREKQLPKEREAIRQEEAAKLAEKIPAPDGKKGRNGSSKVDISGMSDQEFNTWYEQNVRRA